MIATEQSANVKRAAEERFSQNPDWVTFYREILGLHGVVRHSYPTPESLSAFKQTEDYREIQQMLAILRKNGPVPLEETEPTRVITVRLPKSLHEDLRAEAFDLRTSMNKLCISKLIHLVESETVPTDMESS